MSGRKLFYIPTDLVPGCVGAADAGTVLAPCQANYSFILLPGGLGGVGSRPPPLRLIAVLLWTPLPLRVQLQEGVVHWLIVSLSPI